VGVGVSLLNTFYVSNPAFGDSTLIGLSNQSDATGYVIESTTKQRLVTAQFSLSGLVIGVSLCKSGIGSGTTCGSITGGYPQTRVVAYRHVGTGANLTRQVRHLACTSVSTTNGDSGAPIYQRVGSGSLKAAGLQSNFVPGGESCFDPVRNIAINSGASLWIP
jgi:hypothetical protein